MRQNEMITMAQGNKRRMAAMTHQSFRGWASTSAASALAAAMVVAVAGLMLTGCGDKTRNEYRSDPARVAEIRNLVASREQNNAAAPVAATFQHDGGFATIRGRLVLDGAMPTPVAVSGPREHPDAAVCAPGGHEVFSQQMLVHAENQGIKNVVVYLEVAPGREIPIHESAAQPPEQPALLDQKDCVFVPHVLVVHRGQGSLPLLNSDPVAHNTNIQARRGRTVNPLLPSRGRGEYELTVEEASPVRITCTIHPWMRGYLMPRDNGYFAVTDENGRFEIPNVPSGDRLTFKVWHEAAGRRAGTEGFLSVSAGAAQADRDGFTITLAADQEAELDFQVPRAAFWVP